MTSYVSRMGQLDPHDALKFGGKAIGLARLHDSGFRIPAGFAISHRCFEDFLEASPNINNILDRLVTANEPDEIVEEALILEKSLKECPPPEHLRGQVITALNELRYETAGEYGYAVRSSASIEDTKSTSFAGQAKTALCVVGVDSIMNSILEVWASTFSLQSLLYLKAMKIPLNEVGMGVIVQEMVNATVSGVMFTADVVNSDRTRLLIDSTWGLGETIVAGRTIPDSYIVNKSPLETINKRLGGKSETAYIHKNGHHVQFARAETPKEKSAIFSLTDNQLFNIAQIGLKIEDAMNSPQDIEWSMDGEGVVFLQSRPITTISAD